MQEGRSGYAGMVFTWFKLVLVALQATWMTRAFQCSRNVPVLAYLRWLLLYSQRVLSVCWGRQIWGRLCTQLSRPAGCFHVQLVHVTIMLLTSLRMNLAGM
jgi:hypothetical protein